MSTDKTKMAEEEPLLAADQQGAAAAHHEEDGGGGAGFSWLTALGFAFLTFNSGMGIYRSNGDAAAVAFVAFSYIDLVLLFCCLRWFETAAPGSPARGKLKVAVWVLTTLLTIVFSYKVAAIMPFAVQILVWGMAGATVLGGFYAFFLHAEGKVSSDGHAPPYAPLSINVAPGDAVSCFSTWFLLLCSSVYPRCSRRCCQPPFGLGWRCRASSHSVPHTPPLKHFRFISRCLFFFNDLL
jgi:hypothetical protein